MKQHFLWIGQDAIQVVVNTLSDKSTQTRFELFICQTPELPCLQCQYVHESTREILVENEMFKAGLTFIQNDDMHMAQSTFSSCFLRTSHVAD